MLKIKDNIQLSELDRFGFEFCIKGHEEKYYCLYCETWRKQRTASISIKICSRQISCTGYKKAIYTLFDLIQAGFVEKVE